MAGEAAVYPDQIVDVLFSAIGRGSFYAIASDGEQSKAAFKEAVKWYLPAKECSNATYTYSYWSIIFGSAEMRFV